jgi:hypothetical protein
MRPGSGVTLEERQRPLIEFCDVLVQRRVRALFEDEELGVTDAALQPIRKARRCQLIVAPECDLGRCGNAPELGFHVVSENGVRLVDEVWHGGAAPR